MFRVCVIVTLFSCLLLWSSCKKDRKEWNDSSLFQDTSIWAAPIVPNHFFYGKNGIPDSLCFIRHYTNDSVNVQDTFAWRLLAKNFESDGFSYQIFSIPQGPVPSLLLSEELWLGTKENEPSSLYYKTAGSNLKLVDLSQLDYNTVQKFNTYYLIANSKVDFSYFSPMYSTTIDGRDVRAFNSRIDSMNSNSIFHFSTDLSFNEFHGISSLKFSKVSAISGDTLEICLLIRTL